MEDSKRAGRIRTPGILWTGRCGNGMAPHTARCPFQEGEWSVVLVSRRRLDAGGENKTVDL